MRHFTKKKFSGKQIGNKNKSGTTTGRQMQANEDQKRKAINKFTKCDS